mmetsp:Transcript_42622/g.106432  ORF Transcript_42622/g.106432 Transcript_42622/m.106432 type:complete len:276 (-) Transcript_42622:921-1748(-)
MMAWAMSRADRPLGLSYTAPNTNVGVSYIKSRFLDCCQILANVRAAASGYANVGMPASLRMCMPSCTSPPPIQDARMGTGREEPANLLAKGASCFAVPVASVTSCGDRMTSTPSALWSSMTISSVLAYASGLASPNTSTGFEWLQAGGRTSLSLAMVLSSSSAILAPATATASVDSTPGPPALVMISKPPPCGLGCLPSTSAQSNNSLIVSTLRTPTRFMAASNASSLPASEPVWLAAALAAACVRPALMTMIGLDNATSLAAERNPLASPMVSM